MTEHGEEDISSLFASMVHAVLKAVVEPRGVGVMLMANGLWILRE